jgi:hypothetical protein
LLDRFESTTAGVDRGRGERYVRKQTETHSKTRKDPVWRSKKSGT